MGKNCILPGKRKLIFCLTFNDMLIFVLPVSCNKLEFHVYALHHYSTNHGE